MLIDFWCTVRSRRGFVLLFFVPGRLMFLTVCHRLFFLLRSSLYLLKTFAQRALLFLFKVPIMFVDPAFLFLIGYSPYFHGRDLLGPFECTWLPSLPGTVRKLSPVRPLSRLNCLMLFLRCNHPFLLLSCLYWSLVRSYCFGLVCF